MEIVLIISIIVICITIISCFIIVNFREITDYYQLQNDTKEIKEKLDELYNSYYYDNEVPYKIHNLYEDYKDRQLKIKKAK